MGHYSTLAIGEHEFHWKYDIPGYLSFLFDKSNAYSEENLDDEGGYPIKIGFKTDAISAIKKLDLLGMDWDMMTDIYTFFYSQLKEPVLEDIESEIAEQNNHLSNAEIQKKTNAATKDFDSFSRQQELKDFVNFFIPLINVSIGKKNLAVKSIDGKTYRLSKKSYSNISSNMIYDPGQFFYRNSLMLPPWIQIIGMLFDYELLQEYTEIISVIQIRLLLEGCSPETIVNLQLEDMVDDKEEIANFHLTSAQRIIDKIKLYNKFFNSVMNQETLIKDIYFREQITTLLRGIPEAETSFQKGKYLENLVEVIFSSIEGMEIIEKRISTKDEEIDLIIKNSVAGTFWSSLTSPCFFVECKNWKTNVGTSEIRDFEIKINNHRKLVKLGFFISFNGFSKEVINALKRASREEYHIVLIDKSDIEQLTKANVSSISWLEKLITKMH